jgi:hypothetical protein
MVLELERRRIPYRLWIGEDLRCDARDAAGRSRALAALATAETGRAASGAVP